MSMDSTIKLPITDNMEQMIADSQLLMAHLAKSGEVALDSNVTSILVMAKSKLEERQWNANEEQAFLQAFDKLATQAHPVTTDSLKAITRPKNGKRNAPTQADKTVSWYRRYTMFTLVILLFTQIYWLVGHDLRSNLRDLFEAREETKALIAQGIDQQPGEVPLSAQLEIQNQKVDANYKLLMKWNQVWLFGRSFSDAMPRYFQAKYEQEKRAILREDSENVERLESLELARSLHQVRMVLFEYILASDFILTAFQEYFLPLLYGLFGAFIYVLRSLMKEIKLRTYSYDCEVKYRLRLTLGALGGMIVGWFLQPEEGTAIASLSPMALAFLMGYNIELLFSVMDKIIENVKSAIETPEQKPPQKEPKEAK